MDIVEADKNAKIQEEKDFVDSIVASTNNVDSQINQDDLGRRRKSNILPALKHLHHSNAAPKMTINLDILENMV